MADWREMFSREDILPELRKAGSELALAAAAEIERLRGLLNATAANNRTKARELRRLKHTDGEG